MNSERISLPLLKVIKWQTWDMWNLLVISENGHPFLFGHPVDNFILDTLYTSNAALQRGNGPYWPSPTTFSKCKIRSVYFCDLIMENGKKQQSLSWHCVSCCLLDISITMMLKRCLWRHSSRENLHDSFESRMRYLE